MRLSCLPLLLAAIGCAMGCADHSADVHTLAACGKAAALKKLLDAQPELVHKQNARGATPLHRAALQAQPDCVALLLEYNADVNAADERNETPLYCARILGNAQVVTLLLEAGAKVDARDSVGSRPLHGAARYRHEEMAHLLIKAGADVESPNLHGERPLHLAAAAGSMDVADLLLKHGANVHARDGTGNTAMHLAARHSRKANELAVDDAHKRAIHTMEVLLSAGADINAVNAAANGAETPLTSTDNPKTIEWLKARGAKKYRFFQVPGVRELQREEIE